MNARPFAASLCVASWVSGSSPIEAEFQKNLPVGCREAQVLALDAEGGERSGAGVDHGVMGRTACAKTGLLIGGLIAHQMLEARLVYLHVNSRIPSGAIVSVIVGCLIDILANGNRRCMSRRNNDECRSEGEEGDKAFHG